MQTNSIDDEVLVAYNLVEELASVNKLKHHVNLCFTSSNLQREIDPNISHRPFFFPSSFTQVTQLLIFSATKRLLQADKFSFFPCIFSFPGSVWTFGPHHNYYYPECSRLLLVVLDVLDASVL